MSARSTSCQDSLTAGISVKVLGLISNGSSSKHIVSNCVADICDWIL
uniref:Uncharacterized protein n=1 Tax=Anguilla anguilla TaxID=7936 RepID=A0A0E9V5U1_ANGAN